MIHVIITYVNFHAHIIHLPVRVLAAQPDDVQQEEEQGDYVQIQVESTEHILLRRDLILPVSPAQDKLRVKHQILQRDRERDASAPVCEVAVL